MLNPTQSVSQYSRENTVLLEIIVQPENLAPIFVWVQNTVEENLS